MSITRAQQDMLLAPLAKQRIESRSNKNGPALSYLNVSDVRRYLIRIFGFGGFSTYADEAECMSQREVPSSKGGTNWEVIWKVRVRLYIDALGVEYTEYAVGSSSQPSLPEAHDMAIKTAESDALKRCAVNLGDQFGLSLYFSKGRAVETQSVMRVYAEHKVIDGQIVEAQPIEDDVQAAPEEGLSVRHDVADVIPDEPGAPGTHSAAGTSPDEPDPVMDDAIEVLADAGMVAIPEDFFERLTTIREYKTPATRLKHATEFKQELMRLGVRDDQQVTTPNGQTITVAKAFDVAMAGQR